MSTLVRPWWDETRLRDEIVAGSGLIDDVQMSLYNAVYGTRGERPPYADPAYYGQITHPSPNLVNFIARVAVRLGGGARYTAVPSLWRLDQAMGGGKSHDDDRSVASRWATGGVPRRLTSAARSGERQSASQELL